MHLCVSVDIFLNNLTHYSEAVPVDVTLLKMLPYDALFPKTWILIEY